jgi:hypothetical protein
MSIYIATLQEKAKKEKKKSIFFASAWWFDTDIGRKNG